MPNFRSVYLLDKASADAVKLATRGLRSRIEPELIELGPYAGKYIVPADVMASSRFSGEVKGLIGDAHVLVNLDHDELWTKDETTRKADDAETATLDAKLG